VYVISSSVTMLPLLTCSPSVLCILLLLLLLPSLQRVVLLATKQGCQLPEPPPPRYALPDAKL
jgi:hypothetical protein